MNPPTLPTTRTRLLRYRDSAGRIVFESEVDTRAPKTPAELTPEKRRTLFRRRLQRQRQAPEERILRFVRAQNRRKSLSLEIPDLRTA